MLIIERLKELLLFVNKLNDNDGMWDIIDSMFQTRAKCTCICNTNLN